MAERRPLISARKVHTSAWDEHDPEEKARLRRQLAAAVARYQECGGVVLKCAPTRDNCEPVFVRSTGTAVLEV